MGLMIVLQPAAGKALVIGGGAIAARKVKTLVAAEFEVVVIAPVVLEEIRSLPWLTVLERPFAADDVASEPWAAIFACTNNRQVNAEVGRLARQRGIPVLVADSQSESTFFSPAVLRDGELIVGVSTGGASPQLAKMIREKVAEVTVGAGWQGAIRAAREERQARLAAREPQTHGDAE